MLTGAGHFVDDEAQARWTYGVFVRSPHAFAGIRALDTSHPTFPDAEATGKVKWGPEPLSFGSDLRVTTEQLARDCPYSDRPNTAMHPVKQSG